MLAIAFRYQSAKVGSDNKTTEEIRTFSYLGYNILYIIHNDAYNKLHKYQSYVAWKNVQYIEKRQYVKFVYSNGPYFIFTRYRSSLLDI